MTPKTLDHVAFWLADREPIAELLTTELPLHVICRTADEIEAEVTKQDVA